MSVLLYGGEEEKVGSNGFQKFASGIAHRRMVSAFNTIVLYEYQGSDDRQQW